MNSNPSECIPNSPYKSENVRLTGLFEAALKSNPVVVLQRIADNSGDNTAVVDHAPPGEDVLPAVACERPVSPKLSCHYSLRRRHPSHRSKHGMKRSRTWQDMDSDEDDPDKLWCLCRQPHDCRFMICCDLCDEWYHGDCVGIDEDEGGRMERDNIDFVCQSCLSMKTDTPLSVVGSRGDEASAGALSPVACLPRLQMEEAPPAPATSTSRPPSPTFGDSPSPDLLQVTSLRDKCPRTPFTGNCQSTDHLIACIVESLRQRISQTAAAGRSASDEVIGPPPTASATAGQSTAASSPIPIVMNQMGLFECLRDTATGPVSAGRSTASNGQHFQPAPRDSPLGYLSSRKYKSSDDKTVSVPIVKARSPAQEGKQQAKDAQGCFDGRGQPEQASRAAAAALQPPPPAQPLHRLASSASASGKPVQQQQLLQLPPNKRTTTNRPGRSRPVRVPSTVSHLAVRGNNCFGPGCQKPINPQQSLYCRPTCLKAYVREVIKLLHAGEDADAGLAPDPQSSADLGTNQKPVVVLDRRSGSVLNGCRAPTPDALLEFLTRHPTFQVVYDRWSEATARVTHRAAGAPLRQTKAGATPPPPPPPATTSTTDSHQVSLKVQCPSDAAGSTRPTVISHDRAEIECLRQKYSHLLLKVLEKSVQISQTGTRQFPNNNLSQLATDIETALANNYCTPPVLCPPLPKENLPSSEDPVDEARPADDDRQRVSMDCSAYRLHLRVVLSGLANPTVVEAIVGGRLLPVDLAKYRDIAGLWRAARQVLLGGGDQQQQQAKEAKPPLSAPASSTAWFSPLAAINNCAGVPHGAGAPRSFMDRQVDVEVGGVNRTRLHQHVAPESSSDSVTGTTAVTDPRQSAVKSQSTVVTGMPHLPSPNAPVGSQSEAILGSTRGEAEKTSSLQTASTDPLSVSSPPSLSLYQEALQRAFLNSSSHAATCSNKPFVSPLFEEGDEKESAPKTLAGCSLYSSVMPSLESPVPEQESTGRLELPRFSPCYPVGEADKRLQELDFYQTESDSGTITVADPNHHQQQRKDLDNSMQLVVQPIPVLPLLGTDNSTTSKNSHNQHNQQEQDHAVPQRENAQQQQHWPPRDLKIERLSLGSFAIWSGYITVPVPAQHQLTPSSSPGLLRVYCLAYPLLHIVASQRQLYRTSLQQRPAVSDSTGYSPSQLIFWCSPLLLPVDTASLGLTAMLAERASRRQRNQMLLERLFHPVEPEELFMLRLALPTPRPENEVTKYREIISCLTELDTCGLLEPRLPLTRSCLLQVLGSQVRPIDLLLLADPGTAGLGGLEFTGPGRSPARRPGLIIVVSRPLVRTSTWSPPALPYHSCWLKQLQAMNSRRARSLLPIPACGMSVMSGPGSECQAPLLAGTFVVIKLWRPTK